MGHATDQTPAQPSPAETLAHLASLIIGFRIMRETEIAPHWWATPVEIGDTLSVFVGVQFCAEQNAVTMNPNRIKRQRYYTEPIYSTDITASALAVTA